MGAARVLLVLAIGLALGWLLRATWPSPPAEPSPAHPDAASREETVALEERLANLQSQIGSLQDQIDRKSAVLPSERAPAIESTAPIAAVAPRRDTARKRSPEEEREHLRRAHEYRRERIEAAFEEEPADPRWAGWATENVELAFAEPEEDLVALSRVSLSGVDCRSTQCRVEVLFDEEEVARGDLQFQLAVAVAETLPRMTVSYSQEADGRTRGVFVFASEGHRFPGLVPAPGDER